MERVEYSYFFCDTCGKIGRDTTLDGPALGIKIEWLEATPGHKCGEYLHSGAVRNATGCRQPATMELKSLGGSPFVHAVLDARPVLEGGEPRFYIEQ